VLILSAIFLLWLSCNCKSSFGVKPYPCGSAGCQGNHTGFYLSFFSPSLHLAFLWSLTIQIQSVHALFFLFFLEWSCYPGDIWCVSITLFWNVWVRMLCIKQRVSWDSCGWCEVNEWICCTAALLESHADVQQLRTHRPTADS